MRMIPTQNKCLNTAASVLNIDLKPPIRHDTLPLTLGRSPSLFVLSIEILILKHRQIRLLKHC